MKLLKCTLTHLLLFTITIFFRNLLFYRIRQASSTLPLTHEYSPGPLKLSSLVIRPELASRSIHKAPRPRQVLFVTGQIDIGSKLAFRLIQKAFPQLYDIRVPLRSLRTQFFCYPQIDIGPELASRIIHKAQVFSSGKKIPREQKDPGLFDEAQSLLFKEMLPYWAGFCKQYTQPEDEGKVKLPRKYSRFTCLFTNLRSFWGISSLEVQLIQGFSEISMAFCLDLCFPHYCLEKIQCYPLQ